MYDDNRPVYEQQQQSIYYPQQPIIIPIQDNGIPVKPLKEEKRWIKRFYNWVGASILIQAAISGIIAVIITTIATIAYTLTTSGNATNILDYLKKTILDISSVTVIISAVSYTIANISAFFIGCAATKTKVSGMFKFKGFNMSFILSAICIALFLQSVIGILLEVVMNFLSEIGIGFSMPSFGQSDNFTANIILSIYTCVLGPITEELFFRGFCLKNLSRFNTRLGIFASAFLFGLAHGNIPQFIYAFAIGILLAYITVKADSIIPAMIVHIIVNSVSTIFEQLYYVNSEVSNLIEYGFSALSFIVGLFVLIAVLSKGLFKLPHSTTSEKERGSGLFFSSWAIIGVIVIFGSITISNF